MAVIIDGTNNNDKITATDGLIDLLSSVNFASEVSVPSFKVGSDIQFGNAGIITATTLVGNVQGNINHTSNLLLQISGSEKFRVGTSGQFGIGGANYGTSGQVLTSGGSSSAATWSTISGTTINNNAANKVIMGSNTANTLEAVAKSSLFSQINHGQSFLDDNYLIFGDASDLQLVHQSSGAKARIRNTNDSGSLDIESTLTRFLNKDGSTEKLRIASNGQVSISSDGTTDGLLTIKGNSDQVSTPSIRLLDGSDTREVSISNTSGDFVASVHGNDNAIHGHIKMFESGILDINNGGASGSNTNRLRIDVSGHMGLGVLPNANWPTNNDFKALQIGTGACLFGRGSGDEDRGGIAVNWYTDGSNNKYIGNGNAARIYLADGNIYFSNASANSSGANASMTLQDRMILDSNGNLNIGAAGSGNASVYARNILISGSSNNGITIHTTDTSGSNRKCCLFFGTGTSVADMADGMLFYDHAGQYMHLSVNGAGTGVTKASIRLHSDGTVRHDSTPTTTNSISLLLKSHKARSVNDNNGILFKDASDHSQAAIFVRKRSTSDGSSDLVFSTSSGQVVATLQGIPERFKIDKDGKLYKGGNQFYPLVNYVEVTSFSAVNVSSSSYTDLRTVYSNYSPKKAGNRIVIHHQSQMWNGTHGNGNGDVFWRIMKDEGSGYSAFVTNERILGNHDGHSYTGGSGLARHHRTVHLMGSFICNGNNFNLKTQGRSMGIGWDWYHDANNILQIWEYELN